MNIYALSIVLLLIISFFSAIAADSALRDLGIGGNALLFSVLASISSVIIGGVIGNYGLPAMTVFAVGCYMLSNIRADYFVAIKFLFATAAIMLTSVYGDNALVNSIIIAIFCYCLGDFDAERIVLTVLSTTTAFFVGAALSINLSLLYIEITAAITLVCAAVFIAYLINSKYKYKSIERRINGKGSQHI